MLHDGTCSVHAPLNIMIIIIITIMIEMMAILITMMTLFSSNMRFVVITIISTMLITVLTQGDDH